MLDSKSPIPVILFFICFLLVSIGISKIFNINPIFIAIPLFILIIILFICYAYGDL